MSGHSKWAKVKHQKATVDVKKGQIFSKLANLISIASREGTNPDDNPKLRAALEKAHQFSMPKENIERAIEHGAGLSNETNLEELIIEAHGPYNSALVIKAITNNRNRTLAEIRKILDSYQVKPAQAGSVLWMFKEVGKIFVPKTQWNDNLVLLAIENGALDFKEEKEEIIILAPVEKINILKNALSSLISINSIEIDYQTDQEIILQSEQKAHLEKLFETLDEHPDVEEIYSNVKFD